MATNYPGTSLDSYTTKVDGVDYPQAADVNGLQDAVVALETKVGIDNSTVDTTIDYKMSTVGQGEKVRPVGEVTMFGGASAPTGWLLCDGSSVSRTTYAKLFAAIGTTFGSADGSSFNVPDGRDLFPRGASGTVAVGDTGGEDSHTLTGAESGQKAMTLTHAAHEHRIWRKMSNSDGSTFRLRGGSTSTSSEGWDDDTTTLDIEGTTVASHTVSASNASSAHNNIPSFFGINFIIKY